MSGIDKKRNEPSTAELEKKLLEIRLEREKEVIRFLEKYLAEKKCVLEADVDITINGQPVGVRIRAI